MCMAAVWGEYHSLRGCFGELMVFELNGCEDRATVHVDDGDPVVLLVYATVA
jgi:hypothetical protein